MLNSSLHLLLPLYNKVFLFVGWAVSANSTPLPILSLICLTYNFADSFLSHEI